jgi:hypothetical protein
MAIKFAVGTAAQDRSFLAGALEMLLTLCCTVLPSINPTIKSQVVLNLAVWRGGGYSTDPLRPIHRLGKVLSR